MTGFSDPITAGTQLIIPAINSPNYVPGVSGWTINQDGTVEFNMGTFRGTVIVGPTGAPAVLIYDGAPAAGNLILAVAGFDGTDSFGNKFWAGQSFIHGTSPTGSRGRISFGINDVNANDHGLILSYRDALLNPHLLLENPGNGMSLDLAASPAVGTLGGPNGNQITVNDAAGGIGLTALTSIVMEALSAAGITFGLNGSAFQELHIEPVQNVAFAGVAGVNTSHTFTNPFPVGVVPNVQFICNVGANNDVSVNLQSIPTNTGFTFRAFQCRAVAITTTVGVYFTAIG